MILLAVAAALAAMTGLASTQDAPMSAVTTDLAYVAPSGSLITQHPSGETRTHGRDGARYAFPAWSPSGDQLAAIEREGLRARAVVFTPDQPDAPRSVLLDDPQRAVIYLDWRDDGEALYLLTNHPSGLYALIEATPNGTRELATGAPLFWHEAPDGTLAVHLRNTEGDQSFLLDPTTGTVTASNPAGPYRSPAVSPTGRWLAGAIQPFGAARIDVRRLPVGTDENLRRQLDYEGVTAFAWSPQGPDRLAVIRPLVNAPHAFGPLGILNVDDGLYEPVTDASVLAFWWSPNGNRLAVVASEPPGEDNVAQHNPRTPVLAGRVPTAATPTNLTPTQQSARGFRVGFADADGGQVQWLGDVQLSGRFLAEQLPFFDQYARSHRAWSHEGRTLVLPVVDTSGAARLMFVNPDSASMTLGPYGSMPSWSPAAP